MAIEHIYDYQHIYRPPPEHPAAEEFGGLAIRDVKEALTFFQLAYAGQPYYGNEVVLGYFSEATDIVRVCNHAGQVAAAALVIGNRGIMIGSSWDTDQHGSRVENFAAILGACHEWRRQFRFTSDASQSSGGIKKAAPRVGAVPANDLQVVEGLLEEASLRDVYSLSRINDAIVLKKSRGRNADYLQHLWHWPDIEST